MNVHKVDIRLCLFLLFLTAFASMFFGRFWGIRDIQREAAQFVVGEWVIVDRETGRKEFRWIDPHYEFDWDNEEVGEEFP